MRRHSARRSLRRLRMLGRSVRRGGAPQWLRRARRGLRGRVPPTAYSWVVSIEEGVDGTVVIRYAYVHGRVANVVVPVDRHGEYDHDMLARLVTHPPPPPKRPGA